MSLSTRIIPLLAICAALVVRASAQAPDIADLQRQAAAGDAKAQFELGKAYSDGSGVAKDPKMALEWLKKSANRGYAGAEVVLGYMCQKGIEMPQDAQQAADWYRKAARQADGSPQNAQNAKTRLSELLAQGLISKKEADWTMPKATSGASASGKGKAHPPPFSIAEIETGLTGGITSVRLATLVSTYGVNFALSATTQKRLADEGADPTLLAAISSGKR